MVAIPLLHVTSIKLRTCTAHRSASVIRPLPASTPITPIYQYPAVTSSPYPLFNQIDPFIRPFDHSSMQPSGEVLPNAAIAGLNIPSIPGFSQEQNIGLRNLMTAFQIAMNRAFDQAFERHFGPLQQPIQQPNPTPSLPLTSAAKKKRNQKTREQYKKKKAQAQRVTMRVQKVEHSYDQEVEHLEVRINVEKASKHVVLHRQAPWDWVATSPQHAVISCVGMALFGGMITVLNGAICMPPMGVG